MTLFGNRKSSPVSEMNRSDLKTRAFQLILENSFSRGDFTLSSGKKSNYYLDLKPTMMNAEGSYVLAHLIHERLRSIDVDQIGGLEIGAVPLMSNVAMLSFMEGRPLSAFFVRKVVKDHGTQKLIEGVSNIAGKKVVILDDVTTEGGSAMKAVTAARNAGASVVLVVSVVDREDNAVQLFESENVPFVALFKASEFLRATEPVFASGL